jgi:hypothetical protein
MIGLDITHEALFTRAHADRLRDVDAPDASSRSSPTSSSSSIGSATGSTALRSTTRWRSRT